MNLYSEENARAKAVETLSRTLRIMGHAPSWCAGSVECSRCGASGAIVIVEQTRTHGAIGYAARKGGEIWHLECK